MGVSDAEKPQKRSLKPGTMLYPLPAVIISCGNAERSNMLTVAWTSTVCTNPPMVAVSVRPERYSYPMILESMELTVNTTTAAMARATDWVGVRSGRDQDKWAATGLTPMPGRKVSCPYVGESPLVLECKVRRVMPLGSHHMMLAEVVNVLADEALFDPQTDTLELERAGLMSYNHGHYYAQGRELGRFGFSVMKKSTAKRIAAGKKSAKAGAGTNGGASAKSRRKTNKKGTI